MLYWKFFPLILETEPGYMISLFLFNIVLEVLASALRHELKINSMHIEEIKLYLCVYEENELICVENAEKAT